MTIEIYVNGKTLGQKGSGFAVILRSISNKGMSTTHQSHPIDHSVWKRSLAYGKMSANQAEIEAIKFGFLSISKSYINEQIIIYSKNKYVRDMLEKDSNNLYKMVPKANLEQINSMRVLYDNFPNVKIEKEGPLSEECSELCIAAIKEEECTVKSHE